MRVLLGLAVLAVGANAQQVATTTVVPSGATTGVSAAASQLGASPIAGIRVHQDSTGGAVIPNGSAAPYPYVTPNLATWPTAQASSNWVVYVANSVNAISFEIQTNQYTGQAQYRWAPNYPNPATNYPNNGFAATTYTCDPCAGGTPVTCNSSVGPGGSVTQPALATSPNGFACSNLNRFYTISNLVSYVAPSFPLNSFSFQLFDINTNPAPNVSSYSFTIVRIAPIVITGDPQIVGMQGQDFQVHGIPDEVFNMITYPTLQVNARFSYLESAECHDNYTACFAHPGTYISEEGLRVGKDKIRVTAGSFKKGLSVSVNGKKVNSNVDLKQGAVEIVNHRRVVVHTNIMKITVTNSDKFMNQEVELNDDKLVSLGAKRRHLRDSERFHAEVPLHGLQGQTWRNVEYASGLDYEGSITDYHVVDGNLFGTDFVFNQFEA